MSPQRRLVALAAVLTVGVALAACSGASGGGGNIASVNGENITRTEFDKQLENGPQGKAVLFQLVQGDLIDQYAKQNKIAVSDADVQKKIDEIKSKYPPGQFELLLKQQGLSTADLDHLIRRQLILQQAVGKSVTVSDAEIKAYYDKNHKVLDTPEQIRARHILVPDMKTAEQVEAKLKAGGDFAALAKQFSTDPSTKDRGGELGFFNKGQMVPSFEQAALAQPIGKVGPPVKSPFGYHIIQVEERKPAQSATLANSKEKIKQLLTQQAEQQQVPVFLAELRSKANIQIFDDRLKDAIPPTAPLPASAASAAPAPAPAATSAASPPAQPTK